MNAVEVSQLTYSYGRVQALRDVDFVVPEGSLYTLLGPNGSGKTTLLQLLMGLRRGNAGRVSVMGIDSAKLEANDRRWLGYVAEGQSLPGWMRLGEVEAYLAPLYDTWDAALANDLRERFELDPTRKIRTFSRGEQMKAALLCALAPRPRVVVMDEPFAGMDALVKDELVRGLLESAGSEGWTMLLCSHDIGELELLADWVGILDRGAMLVSERMDALSARFKHIDVTMSAEGASAVRNDRTLPNEWLRVERAGQRMSFIMSRATDQPIADTIAARLDGVTHIETRGATLQEIFLALVKREQAGVQREVAA
jgi:ABC-2 type transport system ATP-binding protein